MALAIPCRPDLAQNRAYLQGDYQLPSQTGLARHRNLLINKNMAFGANAANTSNAIGLGRGK